MLLCRCALEQDGQRPPRDPVAAGHVVSQEAEAIADMVDSSGDDNIDLAEVAAFARAVARSREAKDREAGDGGDSGAATESSALLLTVASGVHLGADAVRARVSGPRHVVRRTFYAATSSQDGPEATCGFDADALVFSVSGGRLEDVVPRVELVAGHALRTERRIAIASAEPEEVVEEEVVGTAAPAGEPRLGARTSRRSLRHGASSGPTLLLRWVVLSGVSDRDHPGDVQSPEELCAALQDVLRGQVRALRTAQDVCRALQLPRRKCGLLEAVAACAGALGDAGRPIPAKLLVDTVAAHAQSTEQVDTASLARVVLASGGKGGDGALAGPPRGRGVRKADGAAAAELRRFLSHEGVLSRVRAELRDTTGARGPAPVVPAATLREVVSRVLRRACANRGELEDGGAGAGGDATLDKREAMALIDNLVVEAGTADGALPCAILFDGTGGDAGGTAGGGGQLQVDRTVLDEFAAAVRDPQVRRDVDCALSASDAAGAGQVPAATFCSVLQRACPGLGADTVQEVATAFAAKEDSGQVRYVEALRAKTDAARGGPRCVAAAASGLYLGALDAPVPTAPGRSPAVSAAHRPSRACASGSPRPLGVSPPLQTR